MNYLLLAFFQTSLSICCLECISIDLGLGSCKECSSGYELTSNICLDECPSMYDSSGTGTCIPQASTQIILTNFNDYLSFDATIAGDFRPSVDTTFSGLNSFTPTLDRGFYSSSSKSLMTKISLKYAPDITLNLYILPLKDGIIINLVDVAEISYDTEKICINLSVKSQTNSAKTSISMCAGINQGEWSRVYFRISQYTGEIVKVEILSNDVSIGLNTFNDVEARGSDPGDGLAFLGDLNLTMSYTGFIYSVVLYNSLTTDTLLVFNIPICNFLQFYIDGECFDCDLSCGTDYQCRFKDSCTSCRFTNCLTCTGYGTSDCKQCDNGETAPYCCDHLCETCNSLIDCSICQPGKVLIEKLCLYGIPYQVTGSTLPTTSIYYIAFDSHNFGNYAEWISGFDPLTYYHFRNGEADDPIPSKNRGLYFDGITKFLEYNTQILLAHKNIVVFLLKPIDGSNCQTLLKLGTALKILNCGNLYLTTEDYQGLSTLYTVNILTMQFTWHFLTVRTSTVDLETTITIYHDLTQVAQRTFSQSAFRMLNSTMVLGKGDDLFFHGFIYSFEMFQTDQNPDFTNFIECDYESDSICVNPCGLNEFLSYSVCTSCLSSCYEGCKDLNDCNLCYDSYCINCTSFGELSCVGCNNSFALEGSSCVCSGVIKNNECKYCQSKCASCSDIFINSCLTCSNSSSYLLDGICVEVCPTGYSALLGNCNRNSDFAVNLKFDIISDYCNVLGFQSGSDITGYDDNDPYPTITRGFYFRSKAYMEQVTIIPPYFTINLWVKVKADGIILNNSVIRIVVLGNIVKFMLTTENKANFEISSSIQMNTWEYISIVIEISSTAQTYYALYLNSILAASGITSDNSVIPIQSEIMTIGSPDYSFQGFLWLIKIYTLINSNNFDYLTSGCSTSCTNCDSDYACPTNCDLSASINDCNSNCPEACIYCYDASYCDSCSPQAFRYESGCKCYSNIWNTNGLNCDCRECYLNCQTCNSCLFQGCETCKTGFYLISTACIYCPTGYIESNGSCVFDKSFVLDLKFDKISGIVFDSQSNLAAITGTSQQFYPNYEDDDPIAAFGRGFYFNGVSSIVRLPPNELDSRNVILGAEFTFEIWFYSAESVGSIFCKQESVSFKPTFCFILSGGSILINIYITDGYYIENFVLVNGTDSSQWSYFSIGMYLSAFNNFEVEVQYNKDYFKFWSDSTISDTSIGALTIGAKIQSITDFKRTYSDYFSGFIFQIRLYNDGIPHPISSNSACPTNCLACNVETGLCFSICHIENAIPSCEICGNCTAGCYDNSSNCELSGDGLCEKTSDFGICAECKANAEFINGTCACVEGAKEVNFECILCSEGYYFGGISCIKCNENCKSCNETHCLNCDSGFFYDENTENCTQCLNNCVECTRFGCLTCESGYFLNSSKCLKCSDGCQFCSDTQCFECVSGFYLNNTNCLVCKDNCKLCNSTDCSLCDDYFEYKEGECKCKEENIAIYCNLNTLRLNIYINFDNSLVLLFSSNVFLLKSDLNVNYLNESQEFSLKELNSSTYLVIFNFENDVKEGALLSIEFKKSFIQNNELSLEKNLFTVSLYSKAIEVSNTIEKFYEKVYSTAVPLITLGVTAVTTINLNPASLWSFLSCVQLITYLYMLKIPYTTRTKGLLKGLRKYNMFPNIFEYFLKTHGSDHEYTRAKEIGFQTNSILENLGNIFSMLIFFLFLYYILKLLSKLFSFKKTEKVKKYLETMCKDYKYGFFIRFWIQSYIEFLAGSFIAIKPINLNILEDAYNFLAACFLTFINLLTLPVVFFFSKYYKPPERTQQGTTESLYGSLFYEFKDDAGALKSHYYTMFFTRRMIYIIILFYLQDYPIIQICLCEILFLTMLFLLIFFKPFSESVLNYTNIGSEFGMCVFIIMASFYLFDLSQESKNNVDLCLVIFINSIVGLQMAGSVFILFKTIRQKIRAKKNKVMPDSIKFEVVYNGGEDDKSVILSGNCGGALMNSPVSSGRNNLFFEDSCYNSGRSKPYLGIS